MVIKRKESSKNKKRIVISAGHAATVAISIIEELLRRSYGSSSWDIYWIGTKSAFEGKKIHTLEHQALPKLGIKYYTIVSGRLQRRFTAWTLPSLIKIPLGFVHAILLLIKIKPGIILSLGGFAAFPVVIAGYILRIPVILHEQTPVAGRANKLSSYLADKILLSRKESKKYFPVHKQIMVGHPVMTQIAEIEPKVKMGDPPTIYLTGGSRGARIINYALKPILAELLKYHIIIHQTGHADFGEFADFKRNLPGFLSKNYEVYANIDPMQVDGVYKRADLIIGRAGASTTAEIVVTKRPSILIPLGFSYMDEQTKNALYVKENGLARIIRNDDLTPELLRKEIKNSFKNWKKMVTNSKNIKTFDVYAAKKIVDILEKN